MSKQVNSVVKSKVSTFVRKMSEKYGEEEVNLARVHFQTWGSGFASRSYSLSLDRVIRTLFGLVFGVRKTDSKIFVQQGGVEKHYDDDAFGTVNGAIQVFFGLKVNQIRPNYNLAPKSLSYYGYDSERALQDFDEEAFMEKVLPSLEEELVQTWDEINTYDEPEKQMAKWGFISDVFTEFRTGQRAHPEGFCEEKPKDGIDFKQWTNQLEDDDFDPWAKPVFVPKMRKFLLTSVKEAAKDSDVSHRIKNFGDKVYILFSDPPKDLFSIINSSAGCPNLSWINFNPDTITVKSVPTPSQEPAPIKSVEKPQTTSWADECSQERSSKLAAKLRRKLAEMSRINNIPIDDREAVRCANQEGLEFWSGLPKSAQRKIGTCVRDGTVEENVDKVIVFLRDQGWYGSEESLEEFAICRLAVMNCKVLSGGMLKRA